MTTVHDAPATTRIDGPYDAEMQEAGQLTSPTWELELFLSGAFVFATFQLPGLVESAFNRLEPHMTETGEYVLFTSALYGKAIAFTLIAMFSVHLGLRAYWVALMGLHSVFPRGPKWDAFTIGPVTRDVYRSNLRDTSSVIARLDNAASVIFSIGLLLVLLFVYSIFLVGLTGGIAYLLVQVTHSRVPMRYAFYVLMLVFVAVPVTGRLWEKAAGDRYTEGSRGYRALRRLIQLGYTLGLMRIVGPMMWTLLTNAGRKKSIAFLYVAVVGLVVLAMADRLYNSDRLTVNSYDFFGSSRAHAVSYRFYEDKREPDKTYPRLPSIQSDIIKDPYVKLFIPYYPQRTNAVLRRACPGLTPLQDRGLQIGADTDVPDSLAVPVLECLAKVHAPTLDGVAIPSLAFAFYEQPTSGVKGVMAYIPVDSLARGQHTIGVMPIPPADLPTDSATLRKAAWTKPYVIPFWR